MVMAQPACSSPTAELDPDPVARDRANVAKPLSPAKVAPIAPQRYTLHLSVGQELRDRLEYAQALLGHRVPSGDLEAVLGCVLDLAIAQLEKRKFAATTRPRATRAPTGRRTIPAHVTRAVWERDEGRCTFVGDGGHRCDARSQLEYDHVNPVARGGRATVENMRLRCRTHNQLEAERVFGAGFMERKREEAQRAKAAQPLRIEGPEAKEIEEHARDVLAGRHTLGCRGEQARRAVAYCLEPPDLTLEERMKAALAFLAPKVRVQGGGLAAP